MNPITNHSLSRAVIVLAALLCITTFSSFSDETNHPGHSSAELVQNGDFEAGTTNDLRGWTLLTANDAEGEIARESATPLSEDNPHSLRLTVSKPGTRCGVANSGSSGMKVQAGEWYDLTFAARSETNAHYPLIVSLESVDGKKVCARATIPEVGGRWNQYTLPLHARLSDPRARLVIALADPGTIWLDTVSLSPRANSKRND